MTPRLLLLGGIDPSGGAGVTADATVAALHQVEPLPLALALTEQNRQRFVRCQAVPAEQWGRALRTVLDDGPVHAVKVGLLADAVSVRGVARELAPLRGQVPIVVDPVLGATAGGWRAADDVVAVYRELLAPLATVLTPNVPELAALFAGEAKRALAAGAGAVLQKGGHAEGSACEDVLWQGGERIVFRRERVACGPVRGTGCALATAIAARLARGASPAEACRRAGDWLASLLRALGSAAPGGPPRHLPFARILPAIADAR